jgi:hypothetical protein
MSRPLNSYGYFVSGRSVDKVCDKVPDKGAVGKVNRFHDTTPRTIHL